MGVREEKGNERGVFWEREERPRKVEVGWHWEVGAAAAAATECNK